MNRISADKVYELLVVRRMRVGEVARVLGLSRYQVYRIAKKLGISGRKVSIEGFIDYVRREYKVSDVDSFIRDRLKSGDREFINHIIEYLGLNEVIDRVPESIEHTLRAALIALLLTDLSATLEWVVERSRRYFRYRLAMQTTDPEYANFVSNVICRALNKKCIEPRRYRRVRRDGRVEEGYEVMYNERDLVLWWKKTSGEIEKIKKYIEHCGKCIKTFLYTVKQARGRKSRYIYMGDIKLLQYIKEQLNKLGVRTGEINWTGTTYRLYININDFNRIVSGDISNMLPTN